ncbi:mitochondrial ornithine carrier protein [Malassezia pachydermatis]|uniref:Mitochondrial ornithine carrier protein n=1 Tax=Malassezia pachydermatis TaxID=77020 RepID=A0A0M8MV59_9BASI|nr:mitochondrial ornithine carrier protein [Malassezia pachydermatis]KOS14231.1 mitochondrial ornithine carrier protein [Malassezia pachydermatis]
MISKIIEHPFSDLVKVRLQTQPHDAPHYTGALDCFQKTIRYEGVRGLFRGVSMPLWGATLEDAALFLTYNQVQSALCWAHGYRDASSLAMSDLAIAAAASGAMAGLVLTPVELIKCKMQVQRMGASSTLPPPNATTLISETVRQSGVLGLWHGLSGTLLREVGGGVAWFLTFEVATRKFLQWRQQSTPDKLLTKSDLGSLELATSGAMAGVLYNVSLFPADSVKSTMQTEQELLAHAGKAPSTPSGFWTTFRRIYATRGLRGLYAGVGVTCLRSAPSSEQAAEAYGL